MYTAPSNTIRTMSTTLSLLLIVGVAGGQVILDAPAIEEVRLPSFLQGAFPAEGIDCKQACRAVQAGQGELTAGVTNPINPLSLQILELRRELGDEFCLDSSKFALEGETTALRDTRANWAIFHSALDRLEETDREIACPEIQGPSVMSENQAATLRYAADRVEQAGASRIKQVAATLERADLAEQAELARSLAEAVLASPAQRDRVARPVPATFLR